MDEAANEAVDWAIKEDLLDGLIESEKDEVIGMILSTPAPTPHWRMRITARCAIYCP